MPAAALYVAHVAIKTLVHLAAKTERVAVSALQYSDEYAINKSDDELDVRFFFGAEYALHSCQAAKSRQSRVEEKQMAEREPENPNDTLTKADASKRIEELQEVTGRGRDH